MPMGELHYKRSTMIIGASMSEPHIDVLNMCVYVCMYLCLCQSLTKISLTPIATLYDNGFSGRVQKHHVHLIVLLES